VRLRAIGAVLGAFLPVLTEAQTAWVGEPDIQQQLAARQVAVQAALDGDGARMRLHAAVRINATPEVIWRVLTDCEHAPTFIPGLKRCTRIHLEPDGTWETVEQEFKYSWLMPAVTSVFRADYTRPRRIDFRRISGDLKDEVGTWLLEEAPQMGATAPTTTVEYDLYVDPGFWVPRMFVRHSLRAELPAALTALRTRAESTAAQH
jgi:hypothetical protein